MSNNNDKKKVKSELKLNLSKPQTLEEYFLIIGVEPKICTKDYLYNSPIEELNEFYSKDDFKPKILSKFPPVVKQYINIDISIAELCFPKGFQLEEFKTQPRPVVQHFLLDNSFYSIDYPLKYVTCLIIYESLENYYLLSKEIRKNLGEDIYSDAWKIKSDKKAKYDIIKAIGNIDKNNLMHNERFKSEMIPFAKENNNNNNNDIFKKYYFPKILCLVSTQHIFREQEQILKQLYQYFIDDSLKKIPIEKKILTILCNIPIPPKGFLEIEYNLKENFEKIRIKREKMNKIPSIEDELTLIFSKFSIHKVLKILKFILFEMKTIVFSTKINELSCFIYGLISLIFPFHYSFQVSSSIPNGAYDILESISPYILGINTKFDKSFFSNNKIDISDLRLFIIDLDDKKIRMIGEDKFPEIPKSLFKPLHDGLEEIFGIKNNKVIYDLYKINYKAARVLFFDFFVNILSDYELYIKKDYFKSKLTNTGIKNLFKIKEFIDSHSHNERAFYKKFTETQMFSDFIYKKMIPKNLNEKLELLLVDESLNKINNKKIFSKKKSVVFLDSKEYEHSIIYEIPQSRNLSSIERTFFSNEEYRKNLLLYGQKVNVEMNQKSNKEEYLFEYFIFPILNKSFFESPPPGEYFLVPDSVLSTDVDRTNTDILSKSLKASQRNNSKKLMEQEMQNYIYLTYIELWAYSYWYLDNNEKDMKFNQMLEILNKITNHEVELFDILFEALNKFKEVDKILYLYDCLLKYKILPSSFIYSIVNTLLSKNKMTKSHSNNYFPRNSDIIAKQKKHQKRTFHSIKEGNLFGDKVTFHSKQPCPECDKILDIIDISLNFKYTNKDIFWAKCPFCGKDIIPKLRVSLGYKILNKNKDSGFNTDKSTIFILHSPYELKNNIRNIINKDGLKLFHLEDFKDKYPSLFWSCVWYFKLSKIDLDIILPYEYTCIQDWNNPQKSLPINLVSVIKSNNETKNKLNEINISKKTKKIKKIKNKNVKIKKFSSDKLLIHSVISLQLEDSKYRNNQDYNMSSIGSILDIIRQSTPSRINNSSLLIYGKDTRYSAENKNINNMIRLDIKKKQTMKIRIPNNMNRIRLNAFSNKSLLSPVNKSRRLFETINTSDLLSIKENEDYIVSSFDRGDTKEEDDEKDQFFMNRLYSNKDNNNTNIFNFEEEEEVHKNRSFELNRNFISNNLYKIIDLNDLEIKRNNSVKIKKKVDIFSFC